MNKKIPSLKNVRGAKDLHSYQICSFLNHLDLIWIWGSLELFFYKMRYPQLCIFQEQSGNHNKHSELWPPNTWKYVWERKKGAGVHQKGVTVARMSNRHVYWYSSVPTANILMSLHTSLKKYFKSCLKQGLSFISLWNETGEKCWVVQATFPCEGNAWDELL